MIKIIQATENEIPVIEDILLDTVSWLNSIGQPLWNEEQIKWSRLSKDFEISDFYIALLDNIPAACMAVTNHSPTFRLMSHLYLFVSWQLSVLLQVKTYRM